MVLADPGDSIRSLSLELSSRNCNITAGIVIAKPAVFIFCSSDFPPNNTPDTVTIVCGAMIGTILGSVQNALISLLTILTIVYLSGVQIYCTVTGVLESQ